MPNLAPLVGQPLLNVTDLELRVDNSRQYEEKQLVPMIGMVWKLARFLDDRIHVQQAAGASSVGYVPFYTYKNYQIFGNEKFSGSKADREYWTHDTLDVEKDILKMQAHQRLLQQAALGRAPKGNGSGTAAQNNQLLSLQISSKTKRNRKNRFAYNQRRKAKAAQQLAVSKPATTPAPVVNKSNP